MARRSPALVGLLLAALVACDDSETLPGATPGQGGSGTAGSTSQAGAGGAGLSGSSGHAAGQGGAGPGGAGAGGASEGPHAPAVAGSYDMIFTKVGGSMGCFQGNVPPMPTPHAILTLSKNDAGLLKATMAFDDRPYAKPTTTENDTGILLDGTVLGPKGTSQGPNGMVATYDQRWTHFEITTSAAGVPMTMKASGLVDSFDGLDGECYNVEMTAEGTLTVSP